MRALLTNGRMRSAIALAIVLVLVEVLLWNGTLGALYRALAGTAVAIVVLTSVLRPNFDAWNTGQPLWSAGVSWASAIAITCVFGAVAIFVAELLYVEGESWRLGRIEEIIEPGPLIRKTVVVIVQQIVLCLFFFPSLCKITGDRKAAFALTAVIFGALHLPSLLVAGIAAVLSAVWLFLYERSRRLTPVMVSHLVLAILASAVFPERLTYNLAVGRNALPVSQKYARLTEGVMAGGYEEWKSDAYYEKNGNADRAFIIALYRDVLRRTATEAEIETLLRELRSRNRAEIVMRFINSGELLELRCRVDVSAPDRNPCSNQL